MLEGRDHVTSLNRFYPAFINLIKNMTEEATLFSLSSYITTPASSLFNCHDFAAGL
jgi:hypothetical protein